MWTPSWRFLPAGPERGSTLGGRAPVAQWIERCPPEAEVAGSNPAGRVPPRKKAAPASAYRTPAQQQELYDLYLSGQGAPANPPGTSTHEAGIAVDVAEPAMRDVIDQIGGGYGWSGTIPSEWWHVEYGW